MEKRISFFQFQSVKNVAKAIDPKLKEKVALQKKAIALKAELDAKRKRLQEEINEKTAKMKAEFDACQQQIDLLEAGIVQTLGFHVADVVKKVIEPTGKTDAKTGKPITVTKYLPTDIVKYDDQAKEYVITLPDAEAPETEEEVESFRETTGESSEGQSEEVSEDTRVADEPSDEQKAEMPWD